MTHSIELSPELYHILQRQATVLNVTVESLVETAVRRNYGQPTPIAVSQVHKDQDIHGAYRQLLPPALVDELDQLAFLTDDELWQAVQTQLQTDDHMRMEALLTQQQRSGLDANEFAEAERLADRYEHIVLIRAKAAVLLKERGHEITNLGPNTPQS